MNSDELLADLLNEEREYVEWKETPAEDTVGRAVCALTNDLGGRNAPGYLVLGVNDNGIVVGKKFGDIDSQRVANWLTGGKLLPPIVALPRIIHREDGDLLVVEVQPTRIPPVRFENRIYVRVGTTTQQANPAQETHLIERRRAFAPEPDLLPFGQASIQDLDVEYFKREYLPAAIDADVLAANQRSTEHQMKSLGFLSPDSLPTLTGLLVLGRDPRQFIGGAYVQFLRLEGQELTDPIIDQREIAGPLSEMLGVLDSLVDINIRTATTILESGREVRRPDYPKAALVQLLLNAVMHRTYTDLNSPVRLTWFADRVEIQNPGGPFGQVTVENFGQGSTDYRNRTLASAMKTLGWVQRFGYGLQLVRKAMFDNGNPPPKFDVQPTGVLVTLWPAT